MNDLANMPAPVTGPVASRIMVKRFYSKFQEKFLPKTIEEEFPETVHETVSITDENGEPTGKTRVTEKTIMRKVSKKVNERQLVEEDWVEYAPFGMDKFTSIPESIKEVSRRLDGTWQAIEGRYKAWKEGREAPSNGTPLGAWAGVTPEQAEIFRINKFPTVEDVAGMNDTMMQRVALPGIRTIVDQARAYLAATDTRGVQAELAARDEKIAALEAAMELMLGGQAEEKRGPGRPRKDA